ncbi:ion channel [Pannus brasiliensis CCIBt3594]|uniref:Ion channel n=1 Tax=Pannus brasiliensis CCIBt3594 TaxID=1427578 RepID=A0AAW9QUT4_9CHRO
MRSPKYLTRSLNVRRFRQNLRGDADLSLRPRRRDDIYHWLLRIRWLPFFGIVLGTYVTLNFWFGLLYLFTNDGIANARPGSLVDTFFFSVQTLSTVGYGSMYPKNLAAQVLSGIEILFGVLLMALLTGILFARFSRPTARVMFSRVAVVAPYNGVPTLMFRTANRRESQILEARIQVTLLKTEVSVEGQQMRRFYGLDLVRSSSPVFALSWLVMHPIDENSPFYGVSREELERMDAELWITLTGIDETFSQTIYSRYAYSLDDIFWNARFVDIFVTREDGSRFLDLQYFHEITELTADSQRE